MNKKFLIPIEVAKVSGLVAPVNGSDAVNKNYVDSVTGGTVDDFGLISETDYGLITHQLVLTEDWGTL